MATKSTKHETQQRVHQVYRQLIKRKKPIEIIQYASSCGWNVSERTVYNYIEKARELLKEVTLKDASESLGIVLEEQWALYELAKSQGNLETARKTLENIIQTSGLEAPKKVEVTNIEKKIEEAESGTLLSIVKNK